MVLGGNLINFNFRYLLLGYTYICAVEVDYKNGGRL